jgi:very-short-patch-repair endonuclease
LLEVCAPAVLDGATALLVAGLQLRQAEPEVHVAVPKSANPRRCRGVVVHETRRYEAECVLAEPIPHMRPATAAVHAALWARSDRQAALYVLAAAQQGLFTAQEFGEEVAKVRRSRRKTLLRSLHSDICGGIESVAERDFARLCRERGFPEPTRQTWRQSKDGRWRYDVDWDRFDLTVEIDGVQHLDPDAWLRDSLKQNAANLEGRTVLRIPNLALRLDPDPHLDQVEAGLRRGGWEGKPRLRPKKRSL